MTLIALAAIAALLLSLASLVYCAGMARELERRLRLHAQSDEIQEREMQGRVKRLELWRRQTILGASLGSSGSDRGSQPHRADLESLRDSNLGGMDDGK